MHLRFVCCLGNNSTELRIDSIISGAVCRLSAITSRFLDVRRNSGATSHGERLPATDTSVYKISILSSSTRSGKHCMMETAKFVYSSFRIVHCSVDHFPHFGKYSPVFRSLDLYGVPTPPFFPSVFLYSTTVNNIFYSKRRLNFMVSHFFLCCRSPPSQAISIQLNSPDSRGQAKLVVVPQRVAPMFVFTLKGRAVDQQCCSMRGTSTAVNSSALQV